MSNSQTYRYIAGNRDSYIDLAQALATSQANVCLFPDANTITVTETEKSGSLLESIAKHIDAASLEVTVEQVKIEDCNLDREAVSETANPEILKHIIAQMAEHFKKQEADYYSMHSEKCNIIREITESKQQLQSDLNDANEKLNYYKQRVSDLSQTNSRVKEQIKAIATLLNSIYPDRV